jgi:hypothetical protein
MSPSDFADSFALGASVFRESMEVKRCVQVFFSPAAAAFGASGSLGALEAAGVTAAAERAIGWAAAETAADGVADGAKMGAGAIEGAENDPLRLAAPIEKEGAMLGVEDIPPTGETGIPPVCPATMRTWAKASWGTEPKRRATAKMEAAARRVLIFMRVV